MKRGRSVSRRGELELCMLSAVLSVNGTRRWGSDFRLETLVKMSRAGEGKVFGFPHLVYSYSSSPQTLLLVEILQ
jgi:hypothetical protein